MENEALNRISSDSGTSSFECETERAPERPPRGIRGSSTKSIVYMRRLQFERLCQENCEEPRCPRQFKEMHRITPEPQEEKIEEPVEEEDVPEPQMSHPNEEIAHEEEGEVDCDNERSVEQSPDNVLPTQPSVDDSRYCAVQKQLNLMV